MPDILNNDTKDDDRAPEEIARAIEDKRVDLANNVTELGQLVRETLDVKGRIKHAADDYVTTVRGALDDLELRIRRQPMLYAAAAAGIVVVGMLGMGLYRRT